MFNQNVTVRCEFECCYIIDEPFELNAHRYLWSVSVTCPQRLVDMGRVISFEDLNNLMVEVVPANSYLYTLSKTPTAGVAVSDCLKQFTDNVIAVNYVISAERLCRDLVEKLQSILDVKHPGVYVTSSTLKENNTNFVTWKKETDNRY